MSTASAPDGRHRESSPLHALPALDPERAGGIGLPGTPRSAPAARAHDADATGDTIAPHEGGGRPDERDADLADWAAESPSPALRRGHMAGTDIDEAVARYGALFPGTEFRAAKGPGDFSYRYSFVGDENVTLRSSVFPAEHWGRLPVLPDYVVAWWREGSGAVDVGSHAVRSSGTRASSCPPAGPSASARSRPCRTSCTSTRPSSRRPPRSCTRAARAPSSSTTPVRRRPSRPPPGATPSARPAPCCRTPRRARCCGCRPASSSPAPPSSCSRGKTCRSARRCGHRA